jgi:multiple sugar transport system permease protein
MRLSAKNNIEAAIFLSPFLLLFVVLRLYPMLNGFFISLFERDVLGLRNRFVGLHNYLSLARDPVFWKSMANTIKYVLIVTPIMVPTGLLLALGLNRAFRGDSLVRGILFAPRVLSVAVVSLIWLWILQPEWGLLNYYCAKLGIPVQNWLSSPVWAFFALAIMDTWWCAGYQMIIFLAGLQQIPRELYEAAYMDGANSRVAFFHVTIPGLMPSLLFVIVTHLIGAFQVFGMFWITTKGGPYGSTRLMVQYIYENGFSYYKMGYASALAYVLMAVILLFSLLQFRLFRPREQQK